MARGEPSLAVFIDLFPLSMSDDPPRRSSFSLTKGTSAREAGVHVRQQLQPGGVRCLVPPLPR